MYYIWLKLLNDFPDSRFLKYREGQADARINPNRKRGQAVHIESVYLTSRRRHRCRRCDNCDFVALVEKHWANAANKIIYPIDMRVVAIRYKEDSQGFFRFDLIKINNSIARTITIVSAVKISM